MAFGEKLAIQFHQHSASKSAAKFAKYTTIRHSQVAKKGVKFFERTTPVLDRFHDSSKVNADAIC